MPPTADELLRYAAELDQNGYCLVSGAIEPEGIDTLRAALVRVAAEEIANDTDYVYENGSNQRVWALLNKGEVFERLVENETILSLVGHLLGKVFLLSNVNANI